MYNLIFAYSHGVDVAMPNALYECVVVVVAGVVVAN